MSCRGADGEAEGGGGIHYQTKHYVVKVEYLIFFVSALFLGLIVSIKKMRCLEGRSGINYISPNTSLLSLPFVLDVAFVDVALCLIELIVRRIAGWEVHAIAKARSVLLIGFSSRLHTHNT